MSEYRVIKTIFQDEATLIQAMQDVCAKRGGQPVVSTANNLVLYGFENDPRDVRAKLVVRRYLIGPLANDLGFLQAEDGTFQALISQYDLMGDLAYYGLGVLHEIEERYNYHTVVNQAMVEGYSVQESLNEKQEVVLTLVKAW